MNKYKFFDVLEKSSLEEHDKQNVRFLVDFFNKKTNPALLSKTFFIYGEVGIGKTYFAKSLMSILGKEIVYMACADLFLDNSKRYHSFKDLLKSIDNDTDQIVFIDDLNLLFNKEFYDVSNEDKRDLMNIIQAVKQKPNKVMIVISDRLKDLDDMISGKLEVKIKFCLPTYNDKKRFLENVFNSHLSKNEIEFISNNTLEYSYDDISELIKVAFRTGNAHIGIESIKKAIKSYKPVALKDFDIENISGITLDDVCGKKDAKNAMKLLLKLYKDENQTRQLKLKRANMLLFYGPPGTGKTFMVKALAGELGFPLISVKGDNVLIINKPFSGINKIADLAKKYSKCIVFIDEAEKLFGNCRCGEDNYMIGEFNRALDGVGEKEIKAIFIIAINDISRFGSSFADRFVHIRFDMPSYEERAGYCKNRLGQIKERIGQEINSEHLARITSNMTFRDIERFWNELMFSYMESNGKMSEIEINQLIRNLRKDETKHPMYG